MTKVYTKSPTGMARLFVWFLGPDGVGQYVKPETLTRFAGRCHTVARNTLIIKYHLFLAWICGLFLAGNPHIVL